MMHGEYNRGEPTGNMSRRCEVCVFHSRLREKKKKLIFRRRQDCQATKISTHNA